MEIAIDNTDDGLVNQIGKFLKHYPDYDGDLHLPPAKISTLGGIQTFFSFVVTKQHDFKHFGLELTSYKDLLRNGDPLILMNALPVVPIYPTTLPVTCNEGVVSFFREIAQLCVATGKLTEPMAIALGLIKVPVIVDLIAGKPNLTLKASNVGHPRLHCTLGEYEGYEVWKDIGKGFFKLDVSNKPDCVDNSPLPAAGVSEVWDYKAIYRFNNIQIGNWSEIVSIAVKG